MKTTYIIIIFTIFLFSSCSKNESKTEYYTVKEGESLSRIASDTYGNGQYWIFIARWNNLSERNANNLAIGQRLKLFNTDLVPKIHIVENGESFSLLASEYSVSINQLQLWNKKTGKTIYKDQAMIVGWRVPFVSFIFKNKIIRYIIGGIFVIVGFAILNSLFLWIEEEYEYDLHEKLRGVIFAGLITAFIWGVGFLFEVGDNVTDTSSLIGGGLSLLYKTIIKSV